MLMHFVADEFFHAWKKQYRNKETSFWEINFRIIQRMDRRICMRWRYPSRHCCICRVSYNIGHREKPSIWHQLCTLNVLRSSREGTFQRIVCRERSWEGFYKFSILTCSIGKVYLWSRTGTYLPLFSVILEYNKWVEYWNKHKYELNLIWNHRILSIFPAVLLNYGL